MRWKTSALALLLGGLFLTCSPSVLAQRQQQRVVVIEPVPVGPVLYPTYPYYGYPGYYANVGYVKLDTHRKDASVYVNGGFAGTAGKLKKFALRPGNYNLKLQDPEGAVLYDQRVAVTLGNTTKIHVG